LLGGELGDDRPQSASGGQEAEGSCHGRLPDAPFSGDEDQAAVEQAGHGA